MSIPARVGVALALEWAWNQWQGYKSHDEFNSCATWWGSAGMTVVHLFILWRLSMNIRRDNREKNTRVLG